MKRGATARVLPSRIILPHHVVQGVENYGSSHSGSSEWYVLFCFSKSQFLRNIETRFRSFVVDFRTCDCRGTSSSVAKSEGFS